MTGSAHTSTRPFSGADSTTITPALRVTRPRAACAAAANAHRRTPSPVRQRVQSRDAHLVRARVEAAADELGLRCATRRVLSAVLTLVVGYNRIRDDLVRIHHIAARFPAGTRLVTPTTIGRLLTKLDDLGLIIYRPARGRGRHASIAIHPRFCEGVTEYTPAATHRQATGARPQRRSYTHESAHFSAEIIEFPQTGFLIRYLSPKTPRTHHTDDQLENALGPRPVGVIVDANTAKAVLAALPDAYTQTPPRIRACIGALIQRYLTRGWHAADIVATLSKPLPGEGVRAPLMLARYRLAKNMIGAGPRLAPAQRRWDQAQAAAQRARFESRLSASYTSILGVLGGELAERVFTAVCTQPGNVDAVARHRAVVNGARMAQQRHPHCGLVAAVLAWLATREPAPPATTHSAGGHGGPPSPITVGELVAATPAGRCISCGSLDAHMHPDLPLPTPVCDDCYRGAADIDCGADNANPRQGRPELIEVPALQAG